MSTVSALREECAAVSASLEQVDSGGFEGPTRCPAWSVKELLAHMYRGIDNVARYLDEPTPAEVTHDSVTYWNYDVAKLSPEAADHARELAATFDSGADLVGAWNKRWPEVCNLADATEPGRLIVTWGPALTFDEYLRTRVLEIVVHHLDLEDAFGRTSWGTDEAVGIVDEILVDLLGKEPPHELEWDAIEFIERATGRKELTDLERSELGVRAAKRFPLIA